MDRASPSHERKRIRNGAGCGRAGLNPVSSPRWLTGSDLDLEGFQIIGNDNNLPFSSSRDPNKADDNEFLLLNVEALLKAK